MAEVFVSGTAIPASSTPQFIIKVGDIYYVTLAVWEYDKDRAGITQEQEDDCLALAADFALLTGDLLAREVSPSRTASDDDLGIHTG
jgi:hypothetical protein